MMYSFMADTFSVTHFLSFCASKYVFLFVFCTSNHCSHTVRLFTLVSVPHPPSHPAITLCCGNGMRVGAGRSFPNVGSTCVDGV